MYKSQWPRGLRRVSAAARLPRLRVRIPPWAWMSDCCECCVLSRRGFCDGLITRPEESYRLWRVWMWSWRLGKKEGLARWGCWAMGRRGLGMSCTHYEKHEIQLLGRTKTKPYTRDAIFFSVAQKPNFGLGRLIVEVSRSYTIRNTHTRPVGLLWTSDQPVAEAATYTTQTNTRHEQLHRQWGSNPQL